MTDYIALARECGAYEISDYSGLSGAVAMTPDQLAAFAARIAQAAPLAPVSLSDEHRKTLAELRDSGEGGAHCDLGVGCEETGVCYAEAHGEPDRCGRPKPQVALADKIIADYKEHYSFPPQGESHMHDCIVTVLEEAALSVAPIEPAPSQDCEPTDEQVEKIIASVRWGDGWDGDQWDRALVRAALAARQAPNVPT